MWAEYVYCHPPHAEPHAPARKARVGGTPYEYPRPIEMWGCDVILRTNSKPSARITSHISRRGEHGHASKKGRTRKSTLL